MQQTKIMPKLTPEQVKTWDVNGADLGNVNKLLERREEQAQAGKLHEINHGDELYQQAVKHNKALGAQLLTNANAVVRAEVLRG